jgi:hypothetical protein
MHKITFLLTAINCLFSYNSLLSRYDGRRAITDFGEKTISFSNETNFDCFIVAKIYHCPTKNACSSCNTKLHKKHPLSTENPILFAHRLPQKTTRFIHFKNYELKTKDMYEGYLDGCSVVYVKIQFYDPWYKIWRKIYLKLKDGLNVSLFYDGLSLQTKIT